MDESISRAEQVRMPGTMSTGTFQVAGRSGAGKNVHILHVTGAITHSTAAEFQQAVAAAGSANLVIDLSDVPSVDSMAIGSLVRAFVTCNKTGRKLALVGLNRRVANVLQLTGVESLFDTYPTVAEAESALQ